MGRGHFSVVLAVAMLVFGTPLAAGELIPFKRGSWQDLRSSNMGKPMIVHLWSLACSPCLAELPEWARLTRDTKGVRIVLINTDRPSEKPARIKAVLAKAGLANAENWAFADEFSERLRFEIDPDWMGELPRTLLISQDGAVTANSGPLQLEDLANWLRTAARPGRQ